MCDGHIRKSKQNFANGYLLDYPLLDKHSYKVIALDLYAYPMTIQQTDFTRNPIQTGNTTLIFVIEKAKETILDF